MTLWFRLLSGTFLCPYVKEWARLSLWVFHHIGEGSLSRSSQSYWHQCLLPSPGVRTTAWIWRDTSAGPTVHEDSTLGHAGRIKGLFLPSRSSLALMPSSFLSKSYLMWELGCKGSGSHTSNNASFLTTPVPLWSWCPWWVRHCQTPARSRECRGWTSSGRRAMWVCNFPFLDPHIY